MLTVKTAKGDVAVTLDAKTEITRNDKPAQAADLKAGVRVVVDIPEGSKTKLAHSVKIGTAAKAAATAAHHDARSGQLTSRAVPLQPVWAVSPACADAESR